MKKPKILLIDDELDMLNSSAKLLRASGYDVVALQNSKDAKALLKTELFDLVLCDLLMPEIDGFKVLEIIKELGLNLPLIILTAYGTIDRAVLSMKAGAFDFVEKPFEVDHLKIVVERALNYSKLAKERNNLLRLMEEKYKYENMVGKSPQIIKVFETVENIAKSDANILICGESGTGKELIAKSIHAKSDRKMNPFVPVNCAAFPENLFESEIFGYEKGAYTGAVNKKIGLLEYANTGTFFLDEVSELPLNFQTKLLRVLQDKELRRIGSNDLMQLDVRVISATNMDLQTMLEEGKLREDFYYRLNVISIPVPPLRERVEDIQLLAAHFLNQFNKKANKNIESIDSDVIEIFENYQWPGNVRELENMIERAVAFTKGNSISVESLPVSLTDQSKQKYNFSSKSLKQVRKEAVNDVEKQFLIYLLTKHNGNISKISDEAGMTRRNIYRLLEENDINLELWRKNKE